MSKNAKWISWIEAEFDNQCGDTQNITLAEFTKVMGSKVTLFLYPNIIGLNHSHTLSDQMCI